MLRACAFAVVMTITNPFTDSGDNMISLTQPTLTGPKHGRNRTTSMLIDRPGRPRVTVPAVVLIRVRPADFHEALSLQGGYNS
jgi:hypothetical protein